MRLSTRPARPEDLETIARFVRALAAYERLENSVVSTPEAFGAVLFSETPRVFCELALMGDRPIGMAIWLYNFSTFLGKHGIYLEDLFVDPEWRGSGAGTALIASLAKRCVDEGLGRFEWSVLDWNKTAIDFYLSQGAELNTAWLPVRMTGEAIRRLAAKARR
jgi:GNAT superfamily N-acetyltransferase